MPYCLVPTNLPDHKTKIRMDARKMNGNVKRNMMLKNCDPVRQIKVISREDWTRLNSQLDRENAEKAKLEERRKAMETLKAQSAEMVKNWTNTFLVSILSVIKGNQGARQKKLEEREKRLAKEEEAKVALDLEEAKYQAAKRKEAIEEAKLKLYYETDRVKKFHTALRLTEVIKEREKQINFSDWCKRLNADKDKVYVENLRKQLEEDRIKEEKRLAEVRAKNIEMANQLKEQMKLHEEEKAQELEQKKRDREKILEIAAQDEAERLMYEKKAKEEAKYLMEDYKNQMLGHSQMKIIERLQEEEEEDKCRVFAAAKKKMTTMRVLKEKEIFETREKELEKIREFLAEQIKMKVEDESERIARAQAQKEEAERLREAEKDRIRKQKLAEIEAHRLETIRRHRIEQEEAKLAELEEVRKRNDANRVFEEYEKACLTKKLQKTKELSKGYVEEARQKEEQRKRDRENEIKLVGEGNALAQLENEIFEDYAKRVMEHCKSGQRNIYPLIVASGHTINSRTELEKNDGSKE